MTATRDLTPLMQWFRNLLLGRKYKNALRFQDQVATRSPPPPNLPDGPSHELYNNYYFTRDGRHVARPPVVLIAETLKKAIPSGGESKEGDAVISTKKLGKIFPGQPYLPLWQEAAKK